MSGETAFGLVLTIVTLISVVVVGVMFWWGAREDGREQQRIDAQLREHSDEHRGNGK